ncbi:hypothetical protein [Streptomyces chartreusis]|uniref:hypothetical protein n=1 Tax=Streptomyces chartreusis TaxID=1969 RepID=UPI0037F49B29
MSDAVTLTQEITPYIVAAAGAYGTAVLTRANDAAADATVSFGHRVLRLLARRDDSEQTPINRAIADLSNAPNSAEAQHNLRAAIINLLQENPDLFTAIEVLPRPSPPSTPVNITASGGRSVAVHTSTGNISTGDTNPGQATA